MAVDILVGCPARARGWIIESWFDYALAACQNASLTPAFVTELPRFDTCEGLLRQRAKAAHVDYVTMQTEEPELPDQRDWNEDRYKHMARLRNNLLLYVRSVAPPLYWSLDSDILAAPDCLTSALPLLDKYDAVGMKCFLELTGMAAPNYGTGRQGLSRRDAYAEFPVDVLMASKLMTPVAYAIDYSSDPAGEDIGWSRTAKEAGLKLGWDGRTVSKHVMTPAQLDRSDPRVGW